mgnify:FL=1
MLDKFIAKLDTVIINPLISFLFALAILYFIYGMVKFLANSADEEARITGRNHMMWGIIGITIMLGVWTLINMALHTFGIQNVDPEAGTVNIEFKSL